MATNRPPERFHIVKELGYPVHKLIPWAAVCTEGCRHDAEGTPLHLTQADLAAHDDVHLPNRGPVRSLVRSLRDISEADRQAIFDYFQKSAKGPAFARPVGGD
jgi:hypothetical protein